MISFEKTENIDLIKRVVTTKIESFESIKKIKDEIERLRIIIDKTPKMKTEPDQETLDHWNDDYEFLFSKNSLEDELNKKKEKLKLLKEVK